MYVETYETPSKWIVFQHAFYGDASHCSFCAISDKAKMAKKKNYLVHSNGWIANYTGSEIPVFYWNKDCLCSSLLELKKINNRNIQAILSLLFGSIPLIVWVSVISLALIWYSNFEILVCFIWSLHSSQGQLNTLKSWPFAPKWGGQRKGKWEFAPMPSGSQS